MAKDSLEEIDCVNVLRGGAVGAGEFENGSWRYLRAARVTVIVAFRSEAQLLVVTAWKEKR